jgi:hypothetical protein
VKGTYFTTGSTITLKNGADADHSTIPITAKWQLSGDPVCEEAVDAETERDFTTLQQVAWIDRTAPPYPTSVTWYEPVDLAGVVKPPGPGFPPADLHLEVRGCETSPGIWDDSEYLHFQFSKIVLPQFSGTWTKGTCACWYGRTAYESKGPGSSATYTQKGQGYALITDHAPGRGSYDLYVDGKKTKSISDNAATTTNNIVDFQTHFAGTNTHTFKIVVTKGRIDYELFLDSFNPSGEVPG